MVLFFFFCGLVAVQPLIAAQSITFSGTVFNVSNKPVMGADVYVFDSPNVKRPADYISNTTGENGRFQITLPQGKYWVVATKRQNRARFGPLGKDDKHSGDPVELDLVGKKTFEHDFEVLNLREAAWKNRKRNAELFRISGKIVSHNGEPVAMAYVLVDKNRQFKDFPDYMSTWTDNDGKYELYLPAGSFYIGASLSYPPEDDNHLKKELELHTDLVGIDLTVR